MAEYKVGFQRVEITPPLGLFIPGYFHFREAEGVLSPLTATAVTLSDGENTAALITLDVIGVDQITSRGWAEHIAEQNGLAPDALILSCTHTHTGPPAAKKHRVDPAYNEFLEGRLSDAVALALLEAAPVLKMYAGERECKGITFVRRFLKKDGTYKTFGKAKDPDVAAPADTPDETVRVLRVEREGAPEVLLTNFQMHPDCVGGTLYSADYPHYARETVERVLPGRLCAYFNGFNGDLTAQGGNPFLEEWERRKKIDGDERYAEQLGQAIAGTVLQLYGRMKPVEPGPVAFAQSYVPSLTRKNSALVPRSERILRLFEEGLTEEMIAEAKGEFGTTVQTIRFTARTIVKLDNFPKNCDLRVSAVRFGSVVFAGFPGEAFCQLGSLIRENAPYETVFTFGIANGSEGYFPTLAAFDQGGYEPGISRFVAGTSERLAGALREMLKQLNDES